MSLKTILQLQSRSLQLLANLRNMRYCYSKSSKILPPLCASHEVMKFSRTVCYYKQEVRSNRQVLQEPRHLYPWPMYVSDHPSFRVLVTICNKIPRAPSLHWSNRGCIQGISADEDIGAHLCWHSYDKYAPSQSRLRTCKDAYLPRLYQLLRSSASKVRGQYFVNNK
jgi:hypothetical protein